MTRGWEDVSQRCFTSYSLDGPFSEIYLRRHPTFRRMFIHQRKRGFVTYLPFLYIYKYNDIYFIKNIV